MAIAGSFLDRCSNVVCNTDHILEGAFWGAWCGFSVRDWTEAVSARLNLSSSPKDSAEKAQAVWEVNKKLLLTSCSALSGVSMVTSWIGSVGLISLGGAGAIISSVGYAGSSFVSSVKSWGEFSRFRQEDSAFPMIQKLLRCAFYTSLAAWGAMGSVHALNGNKALFITMDKAFACALYIFLGMLVTEVIIPTFLEQKKA